MPLNWNLGPAPVDTAGDGEPPAAPAPKSKAGPAKPKGKATPAKAKSAATPADDSVPARTRFPTRINRFADLDVSHLRTIMRLAMPIESLRLTAFSFLTVCLCLLEVTQMVYTMASWRQLLLNAINIILARAMLLPWLA